VLAASVITLMLEAESTSETSVDCYRCTWHNNTEDAIVIIHFLYVTYVSDQSFDSFEKYFELRFLIGQPVTFVLSCTVKNSDIWY
jgi:hypothetical protein